MGNPNIVSVSTIYAGNAGFNLDATLTRTLITVATDKILKINNIICANVDGTNAATLNLYVDGLANGGGTTGITVTDGANAAPAGATIYLAKTISVPADSTLVVLDKPIYLMEGDILKGGASAAGDLDLFVSYEVLDDA